MKEMLMAFYFACIGDNFNYEPKCSEELHKFQYALQYNLTQPDVPYTSWLNQSCSEMPEGCKGFEAAEELMKLINGRK
jgi:hypothetical protein